MSGGKRRSKRSRNKPRVRPDPESFWREDEHLGRPEPVRVDGDPTVPLRSIGPPPVPQHEELLLAFAGVAKRASDMAGVLAKSVGLTDDRADGGTDGGDQRPA